MSVAWIVVGIVAFSLLLCVGAPIALLLPAIQQAREAARRSQCMNHLKQIGLALHNYHDQYDTFPPAYVADASGKPMHSWRVLILPYIDELPLYQQYRFDEPWDGPNNSRLLSRMPRVYACPSDPNPASGTNTAYAGVFGEKCVFRGGLPVRISDITDGASNTLLVGEAAGTAIPWMKPDDIDFEKHPTLGDSGGFSSHHPRGVIFLFCDGAVKFIASDVNPATLQGASTRNGDEMPGNF